MRLHLPLAAALALGAAAPACAAGCEDLSFPVYFAKGATSVTGPAEQVLTEAAARIAGCQVRSILLTPEAASSEPGGPGDLADGRAQAVARALAAAGVDRRLIRPGADAGPSGGPLLPPRVMVEVRVTPPAPRAEPAARQAFA